MSGYDSMQITSGRGFGRWAASLVARGVPGQTADAHGAGSGGRASRLRRSQAPMTMASRCMASVWVGGGILLAAGACLDRPIGSPPPVTTNIFVDKITQTAVDKIDLLFMIDNSISMSDKQEVLRLAVPDLVSRLVNPVCVDSEGIQYAAPPEGSTVCPPGPQGQPLTQEFNPIRDINIGIVSSSLGDGGANVACPTQTNHPKYKPDQVDMAHLMGSLARSD